MTPLDFRLWRVGNRMTQTDASRLFGVSQAAISWWEVHRLPDDIESRLPAISALWQAEIRRRDTPMPNCRTPDACRAAGYCTRDPACDD